MIHSDAEDVRIRHILTRAWPHDDLFIEVDDLKGAPVAAFSSSREAARWLEKQGYSYVPGSAAIWSRRRPGRRRWPAPNIIMSGSVLIGLLFLAWTMFV